MDKKDKKRKNKTPKVFQPKYDNKNLAKTNVITHDYNEPSNKIDK